MNKKYGQQKQNNYKAIVFWGIIALVTLIFIVAIIVRFAQSRTVNSYDSLTNLVGEDLFDASEDQYIVFVYDAEKEEEYKKDEFDQVIFNYITFAKRNKNNDEVYEIFGFDINEPANHKVLVDGEKTATIVGAEAIKDLLIKSEDVPVILIIKDNKVVDYKDSDNSISEYLQDIIDENK